MEIKTVCIVGGGMMGRQIALNTAKYGYEVRVNSSRVATLEKLQSWADG